MRDTVKTAELLEKANTLPLRPGVYIMRDRSGRVIYVGKSRKLKNRVSQYFQASAKNPKTERMTSLVWDFDTILCDSEIEALTLENTLIKQYSPKYNIKLKDAKAYPYIKITAEEYPRLVCTRKREDDGAKYFGPYSGTSTVFSVIRTLNQTLGLPSCNRKFPRDIGRERPCIYYQMGRCCGVCTGNVKPEDYTETVRRAADILKGNTSEVKRELSEKMMAYAEEERYEEAARCRDTINALERLSDRQKVVSSPGDVFDVIALYDGGDCSCVSIFNVRDGMLTNKNDFVFGADEIADAEGMAAFICGHYRGCDYVPSKIRLSFDLETEEKETLSAYLSGLAGRKVNVHTPERGDAKKLCAMAVDNAADRAREYRESVKKDEGVLLRLAELLQLETYPERIEAYDISNIGSESMRGGMIVCEDGKFKKQDYRAFSIRSVDGTDDYAAMRETLSRRLAHLNDEEGSFARIPDLILLDGGRGHVAAVREVLDEMGLELPVFGMVKDDYHKTRALTDGENEINIAKERQLFVFIYRIQEEVHRFTYTKTSTAKRKTLKHSSLTKIPGIGEKKAKLLLAHFGGLRAIKSAELDELCGVKGISVADARGIYSYFRKEE